MSIRYQRILIAVDLTENNHTMIKKAIAIANELGNNITLLHVIERDIASEHIFVDQTDYEQHIKAQAHEQFQQLSQQIKLESINECIVIGTPKVTILKAAEEQQCDLIIVGSHDRHGLQKLLGSTANAIVQHAQCDVFVVRYHAE